MSLSRSCSNSVLHRKCGKVPRPERWIHFSRLNLKVRLNAGANPTFTSISVAKLTDRVIQLEDELQGMFERRPVPKAAVVSQMRQEIANLKLDLSRLVEAGGLTGDKECDSKVQKLLQGVVRPDSVPATAFTESGESWAVALDPDLQAEVALLEVENERLREEAQVLLMRQQLLEDLAAKVGVRPTS